MNEIVLKNGFSSKASGVVTGSLTLVAAAGETAFNANIDSFDLSGSMNVTGSVGIVGSIIASGTVIISSQSSGILPARGTDAVLFVSGNINGTSKAVVGGDLVVSGNLSANNGLLATSTTTTFNLLNTTLTGTLNIGGAATVLNFGNTVSTGTFNGDLVIQDRTTLGGTIERQQHFQSVGGVLSFNMIEQSIFYVNNPTSDITANFTNVPLTNDRIHTPTVILSQSAPGSARIVSNVQVNGVGSPINWATGITPTGNARKQDVFGFSLIRSGSDWKVLGQMSTYG
jgi:hypothetical protein